LNGKVSVFGLFFLIAYHFFFVPAKRYCVSNPPIGSRPEFKFIGEYANKKTRAGPIESWRVLQCGWNWSIALTPFLLPSRGQKKGGLAYRLVLTVVGDPPRLKGYLLKMSPMLKDWYQWLQFLKIQNREKSSHSVKLV